MNLLFNKMRAPRFLSSEPELQRSSFGPILIEICHIYTEICSLNTKKWKKKNGNADPEFTAKHGRCEQQWARQPGTITSRAANSALVSGVNLASGASQHAPWVPGCLCGRSVEVWQTEFSFITSIQAQAGDASAIQNRGTAPGRANRRLRAH